MLSGILIGTSYIPFPPWAIFFGFVPLWIAWMRATTIKQVWWYGWITQFILTIIGFNWVAHTVHEFGHLPWAVAILCLFGFCAFSNLHVPLAGVAWFWTTRFFKIDPRRKAWLLPAFIALGEWTFPMIFDWNFGYTWLYARFPAVQWADMIGIAGLSHLSIFANLLFFFAATSANPDQPKSWPQRLKPVAIFALIFALLNILGTVHLNRLPPDDRVLRVGIVQANIGNLEKEYAQRGGAFRDQIVNKFSVFSRTLVEQNPGLQMIVWPETAFPDTLSVSQHQGRFGLQVVQLMSELKTPLVTGGYGLEPDGRMTNSLFVINAEGQVVSPSYAKTVLLAFGEYFPGATWFPQLKVWFPEVGDFARGPGPTVISLGDLKLGAQICYEGLFDWFGRKLADQGAQILVNLTNDSWYGLWEQPFQHGYMTLARALEVRRPVIRSTNTGISTVISSRGEIGEFSPLHKEWIHAFDLPYSTTPVVTGFQKFGYILEPLSLVLWILVILAIARRKGRT